MSDKYIIDAEQCEQAAPVRGRPSLYTEDVAKEICDRLSKGEPLAQICRDDHMPSVRTVSDWKRAHDEFSTSFARAREDGFDEIATECLRIADETDNDTVYTEAGERPNTEWISRSKLRIETRLKLLAKWDPKRYGDKITQEHTGANGGAIEMKADVTLSPDDAYMKLIGKK